MDPKHNNARSKMESDRGKEGRARGQGIGTAGFDTPNPDAFESNRLFGLTENS